MSMSNEGSGATTPREPVGDSPSSLEGETPPRRRRRQSTTSWREASPSPRRESSASQNSVAVAESRQASAGQNSKPQDPAHLGDEDEEEEDEEPRLFPGFIPTAFYCLKQTTRPRLWCLKLITWPYPFYTFLPNSIFLCSCMLCFM